MQAHTTWLRRALVAVLLSLLVVPIAACGQAGGSAGSGASRGKHFVYIGGEQDAAYTAIDCGVKLEARKLGANVSTQYPTDFTAASMTPVFNSVMAGKPDGIIISPSDANAMYAPVAKAKAQGIPVVTALNTLARPDPLASQILSDEAAGGREAADQIANRLGSSGGKVATITFTPGKSVPADGRWHGFESEIKKYRNINYIGAEITDISADTATQKMNAILSRDPDVKAVVATFGIAGVGASTALRQRGAKDLYLVTFDTGAEQVEQLKAGTVSALIDFDLPQQGARALDQVSAAATGGSVQKVTKLPPHVYRPDNVGAPQNQGALQATRCPV